MQKNDQQTTNTNDQTDNDPRPVGPPNQEIKEDKVITTTREFSTSED